MAREARRSPRYPHDSVLELIDETGALMTGVETLVDVSSVGASFTTTRPFKRGASIHARLRLLGVGVLEITGRIVRMKEKSNTTLYAVEFDSVKQLRS
jgi:hypothetical protein